jgi:hypothetical protein
MPFYLLLPFMVLTLALMALFWPLVLIAKKPRGL